ncbi:UNVERIFIED_CONTAM: hypothetical protein Slati_0876000 [Sesamum latifolium]|uniref:Reverse transcriptase zinc-binding domain-containing protein n=1 Tax=Sesamum latifolium TaxID=2727402 RepID=A0AAW2XMJ7_9LAMI
MTAGWGPGQTHIILASMLGLQTIPLVLRGHSPLQTVSMFRFDNYLTLSSNFTPSVQRVWRNSIVGTAMFAVTRKLKALKPIFRAHTQRKGDLSNNVKLAASFLDTAQTLLAQDRLNPVLLYLEFSCRMILRLATKLEQHMLHQRAKLAWMKGGDQCSRIFFRKVASRRACKRVFQITSSTGKTLIDQQDVVNEFVSFYRTLLGGEQWARSIDLGYLRPWARHIISEEEGRQLLRHVTPDEVKQAVFDIDEAKAPGPDGYSSGFFKAGWPIVGKEVTKAILDFFAADRLLKQVNATLLSLIPKNAFVPGRSIGDNILLAQELFTGYNQQHLPPRCALKVDIRKAYDTVEWDFLMAVLRLFGFPSLFISWIEECVTMQSFSVCLNGSSHGFSRVLGDCGRGTPCPHTSLFLSWRVDESSVHIFKGGLTIFAALFGLHVNPQKSHLIVSHSAAAIRDTLLAILDYQKGFLPLRYLGLPLLATRLSIADCKPLLLNIDSRIKGWDGIMLSFAGRVQLIKSVLLALQVYWAMAFILPKTIIREIEKRLRSFLWKDSTGVGYESPPVFLRGSFLFLSLGHSFRTLNSGPLWVIISGDRSSLWVDWISHYRLREHSVWTVSDRSGSWGWRKLVRLRVVIRPFIEYRIGSGSSFLLWHDPWHELGPLITRFPLGLRHSSTLPMAHLGQVIVEGAWRWPPITNMESIEITHSLPVIHGGEDRILWRGKGSSFSSVAAYEMFHPPSPKVGWSSLLLGSFKIPRHRFILWLAILGKLSTLDKPWLHHLGTNCVLCQTATMETHEHLFFLCPFASNCLGEVKRLVRFHWPYSHWATAVHWALRHWRGKHVVNASLRALLASLVYHVWQELNC